MDDILMTEYNCKFCDRTMYCVVSPMLGSIDDIIDCYCKFCQAVFHYDQPSNFLRWYRFRVEYNGIGYVAVFNVRDNLFRIRNDKWHIILRLYYIPDLTPTTFLKKLPIWLMLL